MPEIPQFTSDVDSIRPNDVGMEAASQAGRRIGAFYHQMGEDTGGTVAQLGAQYQQHIARQEISTLGAQIATTETGLTKSWENTITTSDPNDRTVADNFRQSLDGVFSKLQDGATTPQSKEYVQQEIMRLRQHFYEKTSADMAIRDGQAVVQNLDTFRNSSSQSVMEDPTKFDTSAGAYDNYVNATISAHDNLTEAEVARVREIASTGKGELAKAALMGTIMRNPGEGLKALDDPKWGQYLDADQLKQMGVFAQEKIRTDQAEQRLAQTAQQRTDEQAAEKAETAASALITVGQDGQYTAAPGAADAWMHYATLPGAKAAAYRAGMGMLEKVAKGEKDGVDDPAIVAAARATLASGGHLDKTDIAQAELAGRLSHKTAEVMRTASQSDREQTDPTYKLAYRQLDMFISSAKPAIVTRSDIGGNAIDPNQSLKWGQFQSDALYVWDKYVVNGNMAPNDFTSNFLDPKSPSYLGRYIQQYQIGHGTIQQQVHNKMDVTQGGVPTVRLSAGDMANMDAIANGRAPAPAARPAPKPVLKPAAPAAQPPASTHGRDY